MADDIQPAATESARCTPLGGAVNFRHMGGYATADGRRTRATHLFRTGWPQIDADDEIARFAAHAIDRVYDYRTGAERERQPHPLPEFDAARVIHLPIEQGNMATYLQSIAAEGTAEGTRAAMRGMYREMVHAGAGHFATMLATAAERGGPLMISCTMGKDRTGVGSALLLKALGVADDDIRADYAISCAILDPLVEQSYERMQLGRLGVGVDVVRGMITVHPEYLDAAWAEMTDAAGSVDAFITERLGLGDAARARLRDAYLI